ncbi:MAG: dicarboxylate/amino acid:cation symporter [Turicibacter sp.]
MKKLSLIQKIILFLVSGVIVGLVCQHFNITLPIAIFVTFKELFSQLLSFVIPLIIIGLIVPGIANLGSQSSKGLLITTVIAYISTLAAGIMAYTLGSLILPLLISSPIISTTGNEVLPLFTIEIPPLMNVMTALVFAFTFGIGIASINKGTLYQLSHEFNEIIMKLIDKVIIRLVPLYIGAVFAYLAYNGDIFTTLRSFTFVFIILFILQMIYLAVLYLIAGAVKKQTPIDLIKNMFPAYMTAVGTQSSAATIPVTLECVKQNQVSEEVAEFVVPLAATIHLAGDTIALVIASMAIIFMNGSVPTFAMYLPFILMLGVTMIAAPGVPGGGVMSALGLLESMLGFGGMEKPLMIALHAAQDSFGTATNVTGDGAIAIIVEWFILKFKKKA